MIERHQCVTTCYNVPGQTWPNELCWLYDTFKESKYHAEIGTYCGRSLLATCGGMEPGSVVVAVDDDSQAFNAEWISSVRDSTLKLIPPEIEVRRFRAESLEVASQLFRAGMRFDSVFRLGGNCCVLVVFCPVTTTGRSTLESWMLSMNWYRDFKSCLARGSGLRDQSDRLHE